MKRERNFEALRTVSMFFIIVIHCLTHGIGGGYGFKATSPITLFNVLFSDFLLIFSSIAVNLYVMISGYFLVDLNFKPSRIARTWIYTCFYSCLIPIVFMTLQIIPFDLVVLGKGFFPISTDAYWFVTQYIGLLILSPFITMVVRQLTYRQYLFLLTGGAFLCVSIIQDFPLAKRFHVAHGNSVWFFAYLYIIAGFIKYHLKRIPFAHLLTLIVFLIILIMGCEVFYGYHGSEIKLYWLDHNALPFILTVLVFILIRQLKVPNNCFWNPFVKFAPYTFGVYLIHDHLLVREWLWTTLSIPSYCEDILYPFIVIGLCSAIFVICVIIESARKRLFSLFKIDTIIAKVDRWSFYS